MQPDIGFAQKRQEYEMTGYHTDGTRCREGTQRVPERFEPCCSGFERHTTACEYDIRFEWWTGHASWFIVISDMAGGGGIAIGYCPHCGSELPGSRKSGRFLDTETNCTPDDDH